MTELFAIDLGNKQVKLQSEKEKIVFPARLLNKHMAGSGNFASLGSHLKKEMAVKTYQLVNDDNEFFLGKDINQLKKDNYVIESLGFGMERYTNDTFKKLLSFAIATLGLDYKEAKEGVLDVEVVLGLPSSDFLPSIIKEIMNLAKKQHSVLINGESINVNVTKVFALPQPIGTLYNFLLKNDLTVSDSSFIEKKLGIVDIGGGTILYDTVQNFEIDENNRQQKETGTFTLFNRILDRIDQTTKPNVFELEAILRSGVYQYKPNQTKVIDISDIVTTELRMTTQQIIAEIKSTFKNFATLDHVIFTGGGSNLLDKKLIEQEINNAIFIENSEFSNVEGFYKYGKTQK